MKTRSSPAPEQFLTAGAFDAAAAAVVLDLRASLAALVTALRDPVHRAIDLERALGLDKKLAWQVFRIVRATGLTEVGNIPAPPSMERLLAAARRRRIPAAIADEVRRAYARFEEFQALHGGDREGLLSMLSGLMEGASEAHELKVRKAHFRSSAHVWGVQSAMQVRTQIIHTRPEAGARVEDLAMVYGDLGLQRLRPGQPMMVVAWINASDNPEGDDRPPEARPRPGQAQLDLLDQFSSRPLPRMAARPGLEGALETELIFPPGRAAAASLYARLEARGVARDRQTVYGGRLLFTIPTEAAVWELLVPAGLTDPAGARASIYGRRHHPEHVMEERPTDLLPQRAAVDFLGTLDTAPPLEGAPRHAEAVAHTLGALGWRDTRYDVYRCRVEYPVIHTLLALRVDATA
ncbi:MAG: hypothetical protein WD749_02940 [Phycisphaerales bacterium]